MANQVELIAQSFAALGFSLVDIVNPFKIISQFFFSPGKQVRVADSFF